MTLFVIALGAVPTQSQAPTPSLKTVQKIYVGPMGQSDEAERFRILLGDELTKVGFTVVDNQSKADATLSGILTVRVYADESRARATVSLTSSDGVRLWGKDFEPRIHFGGRDTVKLRSEEVAKDLRKESKKK
jgi:hypothetical protein